VALLARRILAVSNLRPLTPEGIVAALGAEVGPPEMVTEARREWAIRPSALYAGGTIAQGRRGWIMVEVTPSPELQVSFEDLAAGLLHLPYDPDPHQAHVGGLDSVATQVFGTNHTFLVPAGLLQVQVPTSIPDDVPDHDVKAMDEGYDTARGVNSRTVRVGTILVTNQAPRRAVSSMQPLAEWRKQRSHSRKTRPSGR
jgi:hypothetical protein